MKIHEAWPVALPVGKLPWAASRPLLAPQGHSTSGFILSLGTAENSLGILGVLSGGDLMIWEGWVLEVRGGALLERNGLTRNNPNTALGLSHFRRQHCLWNISFLIATVTF